MKNLFFAVITLFALTKISIAQPGQLIVKTGEKGLHLDHTVVAKEGFFSIGRLYSVHPKALAAFNNIDIDKGLSIGQVLHIPLTDTNFSQATNKGTPIYYKTGEKEGLMKVSNANNKVKLQSIRQWNKLSNDNIAAGTKLIVGFLVHPETTATTVVNPVKDEPKKAIEEKPKVKGEIAAEKPVVKEEIAKEKVPDPVTEKPVVKNDPPKTQTIPVKQEVTSNMSGQGFFKSSFDQQARQVPVTKTETVTSGIFKTTNGLQDAKYYLLINDITPGTIVRVINPDNNKTIYAKVLGEMNGIRQNKGLDIRISNLAAATLGINEVDKFIVKINY